MITFVHNILSFIVIFSIIVFFHEFGHYFIAKLCKVKIESFSIGFGKELFGFNDSSGTRWKISLIPFGGYVKMFGDYNSASIPDNAKLNKLTEKEKKLAFHLKPLWQKSAIVAAGPIANFILALVLMTFLFVHFGKPVISSEIQSVLAGSAAEKANLNSGDIITKINNDEISSFSDIQRIISINTGTELNIEFTRDNKIMTTKAIPIITTQKDLFGNNIKTAKLGISASVTNHIQLNVFSAFLEASKETYYISSQTLQAIGQMIIGQRSTDDITGPIGIAKYSGQSTKKGLSTSVWFIIVLSINLGLVNLFPIPLLDGGHLLFYAIEAISRKPLSEKSQRYGFKFGVIIIGLLIAIAVTNDIRNLNIF